jgi:hypothetical protein
MYCEQFHATTDEWVLLPPAIAEMLHDPALVQVSHGAGPLCLAGKLDQPHGLIRPRRVRITDINLRSSRAQAIPFRSAVGQMPHVHARTHASFPASRPSAATARERLPAPLPSPRAPPQPQPGGVRPRVVPPRPPVGHLRPLTCFLGPLSARLTGLTTALGHAPRRLPGFPLFLRDLALILSHLAGSLGMRALRLSSFASVGRSGSRAIGCYSPSSPSACRPCSVQRATAAM